MHFLPLACQGVLHLIILCIRITIHLQTQHWKKQVKNERHSMMTSLKLGAFASWAAVLLCHHCRWM